MLIVESTVNRMPSGKDLYSEWYKMLRIRLALRAKSLFHSLTGYYLQKLILWDTRYVSWVNVGGYTTFEKVTFLNVIEGEIWVTFNTLNRILTQKGQIRDVIFFQMLHMSYPLNNLYVCVCVCFHISIPFEFVRWRLIIYSKYKMFLSLLNSHLKCSLV